MTYQAAMPVASMTDDELIKCVDNLPEASELLKELAKRLADVVDADLPNQVEELTDKLHDARITAEDRAETIAERDLTISGLEHELESVTCERDTAERGVTALSAELEHHAKEIHNLKDLLRDYDGVRALDKE